MAKRGDLEARLQREWQERVNAQPFRPERSPLALPPETRFPLRPTALVAELEEVREALGELRQLPLAAYAERYVNAGWTLKDLLAHLASWAGEFRREVETVRRGESFDYEIPFALSVVGPNRWNEEQVLGRRGLSLEEILEEYEAETRRLEELVLEMPEEALYRRAVFPHVPSGEPGARWSATNALVISGKCLHDRYHLAQIRQRLATWSTL